MGNMIAQLTIFGREEPLEKCGEGERADRSDGFQSAAINAGPPPPIPTPDTPYDPTTSQIPF